MLRGGGADVGDFDLIICDEAHRTTGVTLVGSDESAFVKVHDPDYLRAAKRLYMTATPRIYDENSKAKAGQANAVLASMDDESVFGPEFHRLGFGEAVEHDLLTDYKVVVLAIDEGKVSATMQTSLAGFDGELNLPDAARIVGCWNSLRKHARSGDFGHDDAPMRRAVAFAADIKSSKNFARAFDEVVDDYIDAARLGGAQIGGDFEAEVRHVDGSMNILERNTKLEWLKGGESGECRILSNARCLSEGVDVPALDAVIFLNPRKSQVDIVQSVGRVMRKAPGKKYGYIILPIVVPAEAPPEEALADNERFQVVWEVLQALRAHDERFDAMVNTIELNRAKPDKIIFSFADFGGEDGAGSFPAGDHGAEIVQELPLAALEEWRDAIFAKLVTKVGSRRYWDTWAKDIAKIAERHRTRLRELVKNPDIAPEFEEFVEGLRANLNDSITPDAALDMLSQHMISKPVFDALFDGHDFSEMNPVARVMQRMLDRVESARLDSETEELEKFYESVRLRCEGIDNAAGKQRVIKELYEKFFQLAFAKTAKSLGIVYTPIEIVDFIIRSVDSLLRRHFGRGITDEGVHVLDPFTGTGTFIVRLIQSGLIRPEDLARKYASELHANEILLLAYYIAAANIEVAYRDAAAQLEIGWDYTPFEGIVLADTFQMSEEGDKLDGGIFPGNSDRAAAQLELPIEVILGNPPYSVGQENANDNNANLKYPTLDGRVAGTYAARSTATNKNSLYDSYIRAIRWASDRITGGGIIGFVTNGGFVDANTSDGLRLTLAEEFDEVYVFNLRGNSRTAGEIAKREGGNVFNVRVGVAITFLVRRPGERKGCTVRYRDVGDYLNREDKLAIIEASSIESIDWMDITPNSQGDWINQRDPRFDTWQSIGEGENSVLSSFSRGAETGRDTWVYSFSSESLNKNVALLIDTYNSERQRIHAECADRLRDGVAVKDLVTTDSTRIKWTSGLLLDVEKDRVLRRQPERRYYASYRPFNREHLDASLGIIHRPAIINRYFPTPRHENVGFYIVGKGSDKPFSVLATSSLPDLAFWGSSNGQFFPRYTWEKIASTAREGQGALALEDAGDVLVVEGYRRIDNISPQTLSDYRRHYGADLDADDIFFYVYGLLHSPDYRTRYAADLKKSLPRIPLVASRADFEAFAKAGAALASLHMNYENVDPWPLEIDGEPAPSLLPEDHYSVYRVEKMRYGKGAPRGRNADKTAILYNSRITIRGIPERAQDYLLGSRSGLDWILERYAVKTDTASGIVNDPNEWAREVGNPRYILDLIAKVTTVSMRTLDIIDSLPDLQVED